MCWQTCFLELNENLIGGPATRVPQGVGWCGGGNQNVVGWRKSLFWKPEYSLDFQVRQIANENIFHCLKCSDWSRIYNTNLRELSVPSSCKISQTIDVQYFEIPSVFGNDLGLFLYVWHNLVYPKLKVIGFGSHGHVQSSETHEHERASDFPQVKSKIVKPKPSNEKSKKLSGYYFLEFTIKTAPWPPQIPNLDFWRSFPDLL